MTKKTRNWLLALCIFAIPFLIFSGFLISDFSAPPPPPVLPNPNGYDDLVKAGEMVTDNTTFYSGMKMGQLQEVISADAAALALARSGLSNQCQVPVQYTETYMSNHLRDLASLKRLAQAFVAEGRLAELENRPSDAAKSYLDIIHLGSESPRGGPLIDELVGIAIDSIGTSYLQQLLPQLDAKSCRETATTLETLDSQRQTWQEVMQQESAWSSGTFRGWRNDFVRFEEHKSLLAATASTAKKLNVYVQKARRLMIDLAARAYQLDKGKPPASLADLVPDYLKAIPQDPVTGTNMVYSPQ